MRTIDEMIEEYLWEDEDGVRVMSAGRVKQVMKEMAEMVIDECAKVVLAMRPDVNADDIESVKQQVK